MPSFEPFVGLRYSLAHVKSLDDVVCPPYDVISEPQRVALAARHPANAVRLELPVEEGEGDPYLAAATLLDAWRDGGVLRRDPAPALYGYRMSFADPATGATRQTVGAIGALGLEPLGKGILPHEETTPKAKSDRLALLRATRANISPIWCLTPGEGLVSVLACPARPAERATDADGAVHELWPVDDPDAVAAIRAAVEPRPLLIADGHHRYETALAYHEEQSRSPSPQPGSGLVMALVTELREDQVAIRAIHRLICGLPPGFDLIGALEASFELAPTGPVDHTILSRMADADSMALLTKERAWLARPRDSLLRASPHDLDSSRLGVALASLPPHTVVYQHGWENCAAAVAAGSADAAFLLRPPAVSQIAAVASGGARMPPKTTFFWPKPLTGLVMRELVA